MSHAGASGPVVICGGGTAGHVLPAIAVGEALVSRGVARGDVHLVGARRGMEAQLVPPSRFPLTLLDLRNFPRRLTVMHVVAAAKLAAAMVASLALVRRLRPRAVLSVGGYASVPPVIAAWLWRVPIVALSYDALPGLASKIAARLGRASAVAFAGSRLPRPVFTGAPLRAAIAQCEPERDRAAARAALGIDGDRFVVVVLGGSLGSGALNRLTRELAALWSARRDVAIRLVSGARNVDSAPTGRDGGDGVQLQVVSFEDHMEWSYAAADVVVARAGATTVAELAALGVPSILVPWPLAAEDHQTVNARWLADAGGAIVLAEAGLTAQTLAAELDRLAVNDTLRATMAGAARTVGHRDGAARVAELVLKVAR